MKISPVKRLNAKGRELIYCRVDALLHPWFYIMDSESKLKKDKEKVQDDIHVKKSS
jgi:hypothetical protein